MFEIVREVYATYRNDDENHRLRLISECIIAFLIGWLGVNVASLPLTVMSLAISVLTGFSFTALFSEPSTRLTDLPAAKDESDRSDLAILKQLALNFRVRIRLFVVLAVTELLLMVVLVTQIELPIDVLNRLFASRTADGIVLAFSMARTFLSHVVVAAVLFIFLEWIYTFYRLSETIMAVLRMRGDYMEAHRGS